LKVASSTYGGIFDVEGKFKQIETLEGQMAAVGFWDRPEEAQKVVSTASGLKSSIQPILLYRKQWDDANALAELASEGLDEEMSLTKELDGLLVALEQEMDRLEIAGFLSGPHDRSNAIISIHAGAGGTESCDWADMLYRLYLRWAERSGFEVEVQDLQEGEQAGISRVTFRVIGCYVYGYAKSERGVHRLVRISPFDSNKRRHTSFASVDVLAELDENEEIEIDEKELRVDTYRSSGKGGQHVNKTDSAVRLTHLPTGIVVACQNERSQLKNRQMAMKILQSRIFEKREDDKRNAMEQFYGEKGEMGWGNQIRSYVMQPYQLVKDLRTGHETGNVQAVLDGDIDGFIHKWLRSGCPRTRQSGLNEED
jgi:peptide chain release factor 2